MFPFIPLELWISVVAALILSWIDYCIALFMGINKCQLSKLQSLQNARMLLNIPKFHHISGTIKTLHWLQVQQRIEFKALCLVHIVQFGGGAADLQKLFLQYTPWCNLRSANKGLVKVPRIQRARWGGRSPTYHASRLWNEFPDGIRLQPYSPRFRKLLKTWLFTRQK